MNSVPLKFVTFTGMNKVTYKVLGVMSGTSLDGIDLAECFFSISEGIWTYRIGKARTIPYPALWQERLKEAVHFSEGRLLTLNKDYTQFLGTVINSFIASERIEGLDAVCSHGHTILHQPEKGVTLQIGNLPILASEIAQKVVCDFRVQDVALGGQGAPLVPIGDSLLFSEYMYCLNLGGFANISSRLNKFRTAYDVCPINIVLNPLAAQLGLPYDEGGQIAASGKVNTRLLTALNDLSFYKLTAPKSLGLEWVQQFVFPLLNDSVLSLEDAIATLTEHMAIQLAAQFQEGATILATGGGAYNDHLLNRIKFHCNVIIKVPDATLLEFKEALVFGLLGVLKLRDEVNCLASVTGAKHDHSSGVIFG